MNAAPRPPTWASWLLTRLHPDDTLEEVEGDLDELYMYWYGRAGKTQATLRYVLNMVSVLPPFVRRRKRKKDYYQPFALSPDMIRNYINTAWRNLLRNKMMSVINITGLSIGLSAVVLISLFVQSEVNYDHFHQNKANIYRVVETMTDEKGDVFKGAGNTRASKGPALAREVPEIRNFCRIDGGPTLVKKENNAISEWVIQADSSFFDVFTFPLLSGNKQTALQSINEAIVTQEIATKYFGTTDVLGNTLELELEGKFVPFKITAVAEKPPYNSTIYFDIIIPIAYATVGKDEEELESSFVNTFVSLNEKATPKQVEGKFAAIDKKQNDNRLHAKQSTSFATYRHYLQPLLAIHLDKEYATLNGLKGKSDVSYSYILGGIALFILLVAGINFINLVLARSLQRAKEIGVRKVVGSTRKQLIIQFLTESLLITTCSLLPAMLLVKLVLPYFSEFVNLKKESFESLKGYQFTADSFYGLNGYSLLLIGGLFILNALATGFYPALVLSEVSPVQALYSRVKITKKNYLSKGLIVFQFVLAVFLIISTLVMQKQFQFVTHTNLGYTTDAIFVMDIPRNNHKAILPRLRHELASIPGIQTMTVTNWGMNRTKFTVDDKTTDFTYFQPVDDQFIPFFGINLREGRNFSVQSQADSSNCLVNEAFVRSQGWQSAVGKQIKRRDHLLTIIGVTDNYHNASLKEEIKPIVLIKRDSANYGKLYVRYTGLFDSIKTASYASFKKIAPFQPTELTELSTLNAQTYRAEANWKRVISFAAIICIGLSCLGLFGLSSLLMAQRIKEIGIRRVLGANTGSIVRLLSKDFLTLVFLAILIASPVAWYAMNQWLQNFAYRIDLDWWTFVLAGFLAVGIALVTVGIQSIKAALVNPVKSLRSE